MRANARRRCSSDADARCFRLCLRDEFQAEKTPGGIAALDVSAGLSASRSASNIFLVCKWKTNASDLIHTPTKSNQ
jgi:hypothetical protein